MTAEPSKIELNALRRSIEKAFGSDRISSEDSLRLVYEILHQPQDQLDQVIRLVHDGENTNPEQLIAVEVHWFELEHLENAEIRFGLLG